MNGQLQEQWSVITVDSRSWVKGVLPLEGKVVTGDALFTHRDEEALALILT